jgi:hypothetical protein
VGKRRGGRVKYLTGSRRKEEEDWKRLDGIYLTIDCVVAQLQPNCLGLTDSTVLGYSKGRERFKFVGTTEWS